MIPWHIHRHLQLDQASFIRLACHGREHHHYGLFHCPLLPEKVKQSKTDRIRGSLGLRALVPDGFNFQKHSKVLVSVNIPALLSC